MADVDKLFSDYVAEHRAGGEADPPAYLEKVEGVDRDELATLIDAYLVRSPGRSWDPEAFEGSAAQAFVASAERRSAAGAGAWPVLLPRLRERAKIKRAQLVARMAAALGVGGQTEKVADYYHEMEQGSLDSGGVSTRVLEALAAIVGSSAEALREAPARSSARGRPPSGGDVFARVATPRPGVRGQGGRGGDPSARGDRREAGAAEAVAGRRGGGGRSPLHRRRLSRSRARRVSNPTCAATRPP